MSAIDTGLALLGGIVKAFTNPQVDAVIDVVVEALQGVDDIARNAQDGDWGGEDEANLARALQDNLNAIPGLGDDERAEALANGLAAGLSMLIEVALERRKEGLRPPVRKVGAFFAERKKPAPLQYDDAQRYILTGENPFKNGVNLLIWNNLVGRRVGWTRQGLLTVVNELVASKSVESIRSPETIVRDFLDRVQEKGRLQRL